VRPDMREHVEFIGAVPAEDLPRWYATADIFVSPATGNESFGIVLLEAMAAGKPVVCSDIPGYRSVVIPNQNGVLHAPNDVDSLADALSALVEDEEHRVALSINGRKRALEFAWPRVTDQIEAVYQSLVARPPIPSTSTRPAARSAA
jgi:phosphatidyl-myo-inositol alpha-mannosyltransferase